MVVEEDYEEEGTADEDEVHVKLSNQDVRHTLETLLRYSLFTENGEIGSMATKVFSVVESELTCFL